MAGCILNEILYIKAVVQKCGHKSIKFESDIILYTFIKQETKTNVSG